MEPPTVRSAASSSLLDAARGWAEADWSDVEGEQLCAAAEQLATARRLLDAALVAIAGRLEATEASRAAGWATAKDHLTHLLGGHRGAGGSWVRTARRLTDLPEIRSALTDGRLSIDQATAISAGISTLPRDATFRGRVAHELLTLAHHGAGATELRHALGHAVRTVDPDGTTLAHETDRDRAERGAHHARYLTITPDGLGGARLRGYADLEDAERIRTVLHALAAPHPTAPGACGGTPRDTHAHPLDHARQPGPGEQTPSRRRCPDPMCDHTGRDPREPATRLLDALVQVCDTITRIDTGPDQLPRDHGTRPRIIVTIDEADLRTRLTTTRQHEGQNQHRRDHHLDRPPTAPGELLDRTPVSAAAIRRLACDAEILPATLGTHGEILDIGRTKRLVTPALWNALLIRDRHCAFPGCTRLPTSCDAHHITHWADGGATALHNLLLLCRHHHRLTHHTPWRVHIDPTTGHPTWTPPPTATRNASITVRTHWSHPPPHAA